MQTNSQPVLEDLKPVGFRVLINVYKKPNETASGLIMPEQEHAGMPALGQITVLGKKTLLERVKMFLGLVPKYQIGQWVYFRKYSVDELIIATPEGNLSLFVLEEAEIIGIANMI